LVDSERLLGAAVRLGLEAEADPGEADLLLVNTCAFIEPAVRESIETILDLAARKKSGAKLAAAGCFPARDLEAVRRGLPEVDLWVLPGDYERFPSLIAGLLGLPEPAGQPVFDRQSRLLGTPPWRAYLKTAEGCRRRCTYCIIPRLRGPLTVRPLSELTEEAARLAEAGVLELTLVAQDLTSWQEGDQNISHLVRALAAVEPLRWIRLMYAHPLGLTERTVKSLAQTAKAVPYLDVPLQHASPRILKRMGRPAENPLKLIERLRRWWPGAALRTTLMVGFPGETEADFACLEELVREAAFEHAGVFRFQAEDLAPAGSWPEQIPEAEKKRRFRRLMALQKKISRTRLRGLIGREYEILSEGPSPDNPYVNFGRTPFQGPEEDGVTFFDGGQPEGGRIVRARIKASGDYDLTAEVLE
jgi:ribosomal protein S12 methylthiotransferase RimO